MGFDLRSLNSTEEERQLDDDPSYYRFNISSWRPTLMLAQDGGWEPAKTVLQNYHYDEETDDRVYDDGFDEDWSGTYFTNDGQVVTEADALALADGLEKSLDKVPDEEHYTQALKQHEAYWAGKENKDYLRGFIAFCRRGAFRIW